MDELNINVLEYLDNVQATELEDIEKEVFLMMLQDPQAIEESIAYIARGISKQIFSFKAQMSAYSEYKKQKEKPKPPLQ